VAGPSVHEARKCLKRIRALLRLVRPALGERSFRRENASFRETAALLAHARDNEILLETVQKLDTHYASAPHAGLRKLRDAIAQRHETINRSAEAKARGAAASRLESAKPRFAALTLEPDEFEAIRDGLEASLHETRRAFAHAYESPSDDSFHEWRKGVQAHWRHMALLERAWPDVAQARVGEAKKLSDLLGDDHDLFVLQQRLDELAPPGLAQKDRRAIAKLAAARQNELRAIARPMGERLFAGGARGFARRFTCYWQAAQAIRTARHDADEADEAANG
jgi:CHAD domain-containing protein